MNKEDEIIDNRLIAYRNTPRLNSFIRELKNFVLKNEGTWDFDLDIGSVKENQVPPDGILLDGQLIYQEDIASGKVKIPE